jgi:hypothetical protein
MTKGKKSKKEKRAKPPMSVTKAGRKSSPARVVKPRTQAVKLSIASDRDLEAMLFVPYYGEKYLDHSDRLALEKMFLNLEKK